MSQLIRVQHLGRRGLTYPVHPEWQISVRAAIAEIPMSETAFAAAIKCAASTLHETLRSPRCRGSTLIPAIHRMLGWPPPPLPSYPGGPPLVAARNDEIKEISAEDKELLRLWANMPPEIKKIKLAELRALVALAKQRR